MTSQLGLRARATRTFMAVGSFCKENYKTNPLCVTAMGPLASRCNRLRSVFLSRQPEQGLGAGSDRRKEESPCPGRRYRSTAYLGRCDRGAGHGGAVNLRCVYGQAHPRLGAGLAPLLSLQLRTIEAPDLERRLVKLEKLLVAAETEPAPEGKG